MPLLGPSWRPGPFFDLVCTKYSPYSDKPFSNRVLIMPQIRPVTAATMNYSAPILGGICGLSWIWYILYWVSRQLRHTCTARDRLFDGFSFLCSMDTIWDLLIDSSLRTKQQARPVTMLRRSIKQNQKLMKFLDFSLYALQCGTFVSYAYIRLSDYSLSILKYKRI